MTRDTFCLGNVVKTVKSESQLASLTTMSESTPESPPVFSFFCVHEPKKCDLVVSLFACTLWYTWKGRNKFLYEHSEPNPLFTILQACAFCAEFWDVAGWVETYSLRY